MAVSSSYYINGPSLESATAVFIDSSLLTCAPDGFYSDGVISREQVSCILLPQQTCPSCATPCGASISASGSQGIYLLNIDTGTITGSVGAVIVRFDPYSVPDGIKAILGSNIYNKLTSSVDGLHQSINAGAFTFVGETGADCGISGTTYPALNEYLYNGTAFVATGGTQSVTVAPGDVSLGVTAPGSCLMVIPKTTPSPSTINFEVVGPCSGTVWDISVACPVLLTGFSSSVMAASSTEVCLLSETVTYYNASLANTPGTVGLYDFVYSDAYGSSQLATGFYLATGSITGGNDWFEVDSNGVVINLGTCVTSYPYGLGYSTVDCSGACTETPVTYYSRCSSLVLYYCYLWTDAALTVEAPAGYYSDGVNCYDYRFPHSGFIAITSCTTPPPVSYNCVSGVCTDPGDGTGTYSTLGLCEAACSPPPAPNVDCTIYNDSCISTGSIVVFPGDGASIHLYYRIAIDVIYYVDSFTSATPDHTQTMGTGYALCPPPA